MAQNSAASYEIVKSMVMRNVAPRIAVLVKQQMNASRLRTMSCYHKPSEKIQAESGVHGDITGRIFSYSHMRRRQVVPESMACLE